MPAGDDLTHLPELAPTSDAGADGYDGGSGAYDGEQESDLDPSLPSEATDRVEETEVRAA